MAQLINFQYFFIASNMLLDQITRCIRVFKAMDLIMDLYCLMSEGNLISLGKKEIHLILHGLIVYLKQWIWLWIWTVLGLMIVYVGNYFTLRF